MLKSQTSELQDNDDRENKRIDNSYNLDMEHDVITGRSVSDKKLVFTRHQFGSSRVLHRSVTQRSKTLLRYRMSRSLDIDRKITTIHDKWYYQKRLVNRDLISLDSLYSWVTPRSLDTSNLPSFKSSKSWQLSRSAKIMKALGQNDILSDHRDENIRRSLTFDSSPSPKKSNSFEESTRIDSIINTPLHTPDKSLAHHRNSANTSTSSVPTESLESIDENQNRTPQQNRVFAKMLSDISDTKRSIDKVESSSSTSVLRSNMKERIDSIIYDTQTPDVQCLKQDNRSQTPRCDIAASTPRNLFKEFNKDEEDSPHTPENMMQFIPESLSSIKKSHKEERSHCLGSKAWQVDDSVKNRSLYTKRTMESLEVNDIRTSSYFCTAALKVSPKKNRNAKKTLVYNLDDELSNDESISDHVEQKAVLKNIDSSDCEMCEENIQDIDDILPSASSTSNHDDKESDSCLQEALLNNVDSAERENATYLESNLAEIAVSEDSKQDNGLITSTTPMRSKLDIEDQTLAKLYNIHTPKRMRLVDVHNQLHSDDIHLSSCERPITPETINSSRLLVPQFTSVKKSHRKDKRKNKSICDILKYDVEDNHCRKKTISFLDNDILTGTGRIGKYRNESFPVLSSLDESKKKRRFMSMSLRNDKHELQHLAESLSSGSENTDEEFELHTLTRKRMPSSSVASKNYICRGKTSSGEDNEPVEVADTTDTNGRLTPVNMSTTELLCNIDSIKKSHKKDKHDNNICRRRILRNKPSEYTEETGNMNFADCMKTSEDHSTPSLKLNPDDDSSCDETGVCSNSRNEDNENNEEDINDPQPSTSQGNSIIKNKKGTMKSKSLSATPPNSLDTLKFMKLLHTTSIKKSHKKERYLKKESKYILMSKEYDLSDDGSIFDENDRLTNVENFSMCQDKKIE